MNAPVTEMPSPLVFTDNAARKVKELIEEENNPALMLRVFVSGGGCSGFQYGFTFDEPERQDQLRRRLVVHRLKADTSCKTQGAARPLVFGAPRSGGFPEKHKGPC